MKDFEFGNRICNFREEAGLSQAKLAEKLCISNKAVSKWENGNAKPSIEQTLKLSKIFNVSLEDLLGVNEKVKTKIIRKIVITGGPCSGKSTALSWLQTEFSKKGYYVLFVPETATEVIGGGITKKSMERNFDFEMAIMKLQIEKEKIFEESAKKVKDFEKVLIVCDRGCLDCKAYLTKEEFKKCLKEIQKTEVDLRDSYDAVFHLVTAAKGAEEFYTMSNNQARQEGMDEAIEKDEATLNSWVGHPHLRVIDNSTGFEQKMRRLIKEISCFLGEPAPYEIERKFLIEYPNLKKLEKMKNCNKSEIIQTYLKSEGTDELRIRQRGMKGDYVYTKTSKKVVSGNKRIEIEKRISEKEYLELLIDADPNKRPIIKTRYCLMHKNQYFEIDVYPMWKDKAVVEIELNHEDEKFEIPSFLKVIKEVTLDKEYSNYSLASRSE